jgi:hypothetical protein
LPIWKRRSSSVKEVAPVAQGIEQRFPKANWPIPAKPKEHAKALENKGFLHVLARAQNVPKRPETGRSGSIDYPASTSVAAPAPDK